MLRWNSTAHCIYAPIFYICTSQVTAQAQAPLPISASDVHPFCTSEKWTAVSGAVVGNWQRINDARIDDAEYRGWVFEGEAMLGNKKIFLYKAKLSITGARIYESIYGFSEPIFSVNLDKDIRGAEFKIRDDAEDAVKKNGSSLERLIVQDTKSKVSFWTFEGRLLFTFEGNGGYLIAELKKEGVSNICSHAQASPHW